MNCQARIMKEFKTRKADSAHPNFKDFDKYAPCNGEITITALVKSVADWGSTDYILAVEIDCSRCKYPYVENWNEFRHQVAMAQKLDVTTVLLDRQSPWVGNSN